MARKKSEPRGKYPLTGEPELEGIAGALVLLLADLPPLAQLIVVRAAVDPSIIVSMGHVNLNHAVQAMGAEVSNLEGYLDGTSGLGRIAAQNAHEHVKLLKSYLTNLQLTLNVL